MTKCKSCGKPIQWIKMASGKMMPRDAGLYMLKSGETGLFVTDDGHVERVTQTGRDVQGGHLSHFATCPQANEHKR